MDICFKEANTMDLWKLHDKQKKLVIGLMSGTSADGIDAALTEITGCGTSTKVKQLGFVSIPFADEIRERILKVVNGHFGGTEEICLLSFLLGRLFTEACFAVCEVSGVSPSDIDLVGSHGQTVWHIPVAQKYLGYDVRGTLQIGEASLINEAFGCPVVSDFRVRDMAAGGLGAPLVPYTEFLLYRDPERNVALQNIGGIGNITWLPKDCALSDVFAFDTGPGNMVMDQIVARLTDGKLRFDDGGRLAAAGSVNEKLLAWMLQDDYLTAPLPKTTGRERYGIPYVEELLQKADAFGVSLQDTLSTATMFTARCIAAGTEHFPARPDRLIVGGGGSLNPTLMAMIGQVLPGTEVLRNEDLGYDSEAKEAVAFAVLANETIAGLPSNAPGATGASKPVVLGKISQ